MKNDVLIQKYLTKCCAICGRAHEIEIRKRDSQALVRGESVSFEETYYLCPDGGYVDDGYAPAVIMDENLLRARDAYRTKHGLLTSTEIIKIREKFGYSQEEFSLALKLDQDAVQRFETKEIQTYKTDIWIRNFYPRK